MSAIPRLSSLAPIPSLSNDLTTNHETTAVVELVDEPDDDDSWSSDSDPARRCREDERHLALLRASGRKF
jgi:hypothetical protein